MCACVVGVTGRTALEEEEATGAGCRLQRGRNGGFGAGEQLGREGKLKEEKTWCISCR